MLRPCIEKATGNVVLKNVESVDLSKFDVIYEEKEGNRGTIDAVSGSIVSSPSAFAEKSAELLVSIENSKIEEAVAKNPTSKKRK